MARQRTAGDTMITREYRVVTPAIPRTRTTNR